MTTSLRPSGHNTDVVKGLDTLSYGAGCRFKSGLGQLVTGKTRHPTSKWVPGTFFKPGKDKADKGEGSAPSFIHCAQDTVGL